jgi:hypothetical protein
VARSETPPTRSGRSFLLGLSVVGALAMGGGVVAMRYRAKPIVAPTSAVEAAMTLPAPTVPAPSAREIIVTTQPRDAKRQLDGATFEKLRVLLPADRLPHKLEVSAPGYHPRVVMLDEKSPDEIDVQLTALAVDKPTKGAAKKPKRATHPPTKGLPKLLPP